MKLFKGKQKQRFYKFLLVGLISTIIDFGFMNLFTIEFKIPLVLSQGISFMIAVLGSYLMNRYWIYPDSREKSAYKQLFLFVLINLVGIGIRTLSIPRLDKLFLSFFTNLDATFIVANNTIISQNLALALVVGIVLLWNFFANRYLTFSDIKN